MTLQASEAEKIDHSWLVAAEVGCGDAN